MPKINILPAKVYNRIAAGEVVDRPCSVVKELVENSIDAGSDSVTVEIQNGGNTFIRVTDNGCGIDYEDIPKAFLRHATSNANYKVRIFSFNSFQLANFTSNFLFRTFAHAASVNDNHISVVEISNSFVAKLFQLTSVMLGITLIHLTTVIE